MSILGLFDGVPRVVASSVFGRSLLNLPTASDLKSLSTPTVYTVSATGAYSIPANADIIYRTSTLSSAMTVMTLPNNSVAGTRIKIIDAAPLSHLSPIRVNKPTAAGATLTALAGKPDISFWDFSLNISTATFLCLGDNNWIIESHDGDFDYGGRFIKYGCDFLDPADYTATVFSGVSAAVSNITISGRYGVMSLETGTETFGRSAWLHRTGNTQTGNQNILTISSGVILKYSCVFQLPLLSDALNRFTFRSGLINNVGAGEFTNHILLRYTDNQNSGRFHVVTRVDSVDAATDTSVTPVAGTWYHHVIYYANNTLSQSLRVAGAYSDEVKTSDFTTWQRTDSIPVNRGMGRMIGVQKGAGTVNRQVYVDSSHMFYQGA